MIVTKIREFSHNYKNQQNFGKKNKNTEPIHKVNNDTVQKILLKNKKYETSPKNNNSKIDPEIEEYIYILKTELAKRVRDMSNEEKYNYILGKNQDFVAQNLSKGLADAQRKLRELRIQRMKQENL